MAPTETAPTRPTAYYCPFCGSENSISYPEGGLDSEQPTNEACANCDTPQNVRIDTRGGPSQYEIGWLRDVDNRPSSGWAEDIDFECPDCGLLHTISIPATDFHADEFECDGHQLRFVRSLMSESPNPYVSYKIAVHEEQS